MKSKILIALLLILAIVMTLVGCKDDEDGNNNTPGGDISGNEGGDNNENSGDNTTDGGNNENNPGSGSGNNQTHTHTFDVWNVAIPATCTNEGEEISTCSCGEILQRSISRLEHDFSQFAGTIDPTCSSNGYTYYECAYGCGQIISEPIDFIGHSYVESTVSPTCDEWGRIEHTCSVCGDSYSTDPVAPVGHAFGEWSVVEPTFGKEGSRSRSCSNCNETEMLAISAIDFRASYSKQGDYDVVRIDRSTPGQADSYSISKNGYSIFEIVGEYVDPSEIEIVYFGDNVTRAYFDGGSLREVHFSDDIEYISGKAFWINEQLGKIYFEGDAPEIHTQAFNLNGSGKAAIYPTEQSRGFDDFLFGGCEVIRRWITKDKLDIDSLTLKEYAALAANHTDALALEILSLFEMRGQETFLYLPFEPDIDSYRIIKDFTISLTKNCKTEREKIDAIYDWIVANIEYSDPAVFYTSYEVFESRSAVCAGYTNLMHDMLCAVGIPSFYTRGTTLFGCGRSVSDVFTDPDGFSTHAWLSVITSDGKVSYYDTTWGVSNPSEYKNMTAAKVGEYAVTFEINSLQLMVDGVDHNSFKINDGIQFIVDGMIYSTFFGKVGSQSIAEHYNYWFSFNHITVTGDHYISELDQPNGSVYNCGFVSDYWLGNTNFCLADGRVIPLYRVTDYLLMQSRYYGEGIDYSCDFMVYENGFLFVIDEMNDVARVALYIGDEENITVPSTVRGIPVVTISQEAFKNNDKVKRLVISEGVKYIYEGSFEGCETLEYIYLPASYEWENGEMTEHTVFSRCYNLKTVEISENHPHFASYNGNLYTKDMKILIFYAPNNDYNIFTVPESVTEIYKGAFAYSKLESVILHDGVTKIWSEAFWHSRIEYIDIPAGCGIGEYAFHYATALRRVSFGDGITEIPTAAFNNCQSLVKIKLPSTLTSIGSFAFGSSLSLITIDLPEGLKSIGYCAFVDSALVSVTLPSTLELIDYDAFFCCEALFVVNNNSSLELIPYDQNSHGGVTARVRKLNADPKSYSITVTDNGLVFYADEQTVILVDFIGCEGDTLILPESFDGRSYKMLTKCFASFDFIGYIQQWTEIFTWEDYAFHYGQQIKYLVIPASITEIPDYAFEGWANIEKIYYGGTRETWEKEEMFDRKPEPLDPEQIPKNDELMTPDVYFFSQNKPTEEGNFWHYVNGVPTSW